MGCNSVLFVSQKLEEEVWVAGRDEKEARQRAAEKLCVLPEDILLLQGNIAPLR